VTAGLDPATMVASAEESTGLGNWGDPVWRDGFEVLVAALNDAELNETGVVSMEVRLGMYLEQRLRVLDWRSRNPEIDDEVVVGPMIITGLPRTGTTALSYLFAQDPDTRSLRVWESARPTPPPEAATYRTDPRVAETQAGLDLMNELVPDFKRLYDATSAEDTAEGIDLLGMSFRTHHFAGQADVRVYDDWWLGCDMVPAYRFHHEVLQLLQWRCPPNRWHLKNPPDLFCLEAIDAVYPDARFVWTHRDPARVLPSVCQLVAAVRAMATDEVDRRALGPYHVDLWTEAVDRAMAARERLGEDRFADVHLGDLQVDPVTAVAGAYERVGWPFTEEAERRVAEWAANRPPDRHGRHEEPEPADFGLDMDEVRERFGAYLDRFGVLEGETA